MPSTTSLLKKLKTTYPQFTFQIGEQFQWDATARAITYPETIEDSGWEAQILHEVAHALLNHHRYNRDIELIAIERDAWRYARSHLADVFEVTIDTPTVETALDSYRDWLHERSLCPQCTASGIETAKHTYTCVACRHQWRVNEARLCGLKRFSIKK